MSALNRILNEIDQLAAETKEHILAQAQQTAAEITAQSAQECHALEQQMQQQAQLLYTEAQQRAQSSNRLARRRALLQARNEVIDDVIAQAKDQIITMPQEDYFELLFHLFEQNAQPLDGVLHIGAADFDAMPPGFVARLQQVQPDHSLALAEQNPAGHGFVIEYGNVLYNCMIDAIFQAQWQALRDKIHEVLQ